MDERTLVKWRPSYDPGWDRLRFVDETRHGPLIAILRPVLEAAGWPAKCYRADCRRATRCVAPRTDCAFRDVRILRRDVFPYLIAYAAERENRVAPPPTAESGTPGKIAVAKPRPRNLPAR